MYISEQTLKDNFWKYYNSKNRAVKYQFESELREGGVDSITLEMYQQNLRKKA